MSTILMVSMPKLGHIMPMIGVAKRLKLLGLDVIILTGQPFEPFLRAEGLTFQPFKDLEQAETHPNPLEIPHTALEIWRNELGDRSQTGGRLRARIDELMQQHKISLLVMDGSFIKRPTGLHEYLRSHYKLVLLRTSLPGLEEYKNKVAGTELVLCPPSFELVSFREASGNRVFCEPSIPSWRSKMILRDPYPRVAVAFGTQMPLAARLLRISMVLSVAKHFSDVRFHIATGLEVNTLVSDDDVHRIKLVRHFDQRSELSAADAFIGHGGLGGIKECLFMGKPQMAIPYEHDQFENAQRLQTLGLGFDINASSASVGVLCEMVGRMLFTDKLTARVSHTSMEFQEAEQRPTAAKKIAGLID